MITNRTFLCENPTDLCTSLFPQDWVLEDIVFFDIETTGLSPRKSRVFLIGALHKPQNKDAIELIQFLAEKSDDQEEQAVLQAFSQLLKGKKHLAHFNGSSFDIPYLTYRYGLHQMENPLPFMTQTDLYRRLKDFSGFFRQLPDHRQKTFEELVGYPRKDLLSGKEMIKIYQNYVTTPSSELLKLLFLHNYDDLKGMLSILPLGELGQLAQGKFQVLETREIQEKTLEGFIIRCLLFELELPSSIPARLSAGQNHLYTVVEGKKAKIKIPLYEGTLKYFYPDYRNYYYLPLEDQAIHKSVAMYMDSSRREKAKASNCYRKYTGTFVSLPCTSPIPDSQLPPLRENIDSKETYTAWPFQDAAPEVLKYYLSQICRELCR